MRAAVIDGDDAAVETHLSTAQSAARAAARWTAGPVWSVAAAVPWVGDPIDTTRGLARVSRGLTDDVLPQVVAAADALAPDRLRVAGDAVDLGLLAREQPVIARARAAAAGVQTSVDRLPAQTWLAPVDHARTQLHDMLGEFMTTVSGADSAARLLPSMLGRDGPRNYLVVFENEAESRGLGGLPGAFAVLHADQGRIAFRHFGNDSDIAQMQLDLRRYGKDFQFRYTQYGAGELFVNSNMSPHFPDVAQIWMQMWRRTFDQKLDGALAMDPTALSYLLKVTGPVTLADGTSLTVDNVVARTENKVYADIADPAAQNAYFVDVARTLARELLGVSGHSRELLAAMGRAIDERRLMLWSARPAEEAQIAALPLSGALPQTRTPFTALVVNNGAGSKLDYYLDRSLTYEPAGCRGDRRMVRVTVSLRNDAPAVGLPPYVTIRADHPLRAFPSSNKVLVSLYATQGARLRGLDVDGAPHHAIAERERGHPVFTVPLGLNAGQTRTLTFRLAEPRSSGPVHTLTQPLVRPETDRITQPTC